MINLVINLFAFAIHLVDKGLKVANKIKIVIIKIEQFE